MHVLYSLNNSSNFDNSVQRVKHWSSDRSPAGPTGSALSPSSSAVQLAGVGLAMAVTNPGALPDAGSSLAVPNLSTSQRKRIRSYLKRCRVHPRHSQLNLEGYLLLPVQRVPRYRLLVSLRYFGNAILSDNILAGRVATQHTAFT